MDRSIMKLLEEDEDETMHSGADVDAFTAALNRDIEGDNNNSSVSSSQSQSQPQPLSSTDVLSQGMNRTPSQLFQQWQSSKREVEVKVETQEQQQSSVMEINRHPPNDTSSQMTPHDDSSLQQAKQLKKPAQNVARIQDNESQLQRMQRIGMATGHTANNAMNRPSGKQVPFALLLPVILPQLDKQRSMQLENLYAQLRLSAKQSSQTPSAYVPTLSIHQSSDSSSLPMDNSAQKHQSGSHGVQASHMSSNISAIRQERQQHIQFPQSSFPTYGNTGAHFHQSSSPNMNMSSQSYKQQIHDLQMRQGPVHSSIGTQSMNQNVFSDMKRPHDTNNSSLQQTSYHWQPSMNKVKSEYVDQVNDQERHKVKLSTPQWAYSVSSVQQKSSKDEIIKMLSSRPGFLTSMNKPEPMSITAQLERQNMAGGNTSLVSGSNAKTPPKKPTVGQKKPLETPVSSIIRSKKCPERLQIKVLSSLMM